MRLSLLLLIALMVSGQTMANPAQRFSNLLEQTESVRGLGEQEPIVEACGEQTKKDFVQLVAAGDASLSFDPWYLWYNEMADIDPDDYGTAQSYLDALTAPLAVDGRDPGFSYLTTQAEDDARGSTGAYVGYGFRFTIDDLGRFIFVDVLQDTPAGLANFDRGNEIVAMDVGNGFETIEEISQRHFYLGTLLDEMFGPSEAGVERGFRVRQGSATVEATLVKTELVTPPLAVEPLLLERTGTTPVGYLHLRSFIGTANDALDDAMAVFGQAGVEDLVIDFRYNGGGRPDVADRMLDLLAGTLPSAIGQESWRLAHNDRRSEEDFGASFAPLPDSIRPLRIAFITTGGTASASELVINSLSPHIEVVLVGENTLGKAVGQYAFDQNLGPPEWASCDTRLRLITFEIVNGEGNGGYYNGLVDAGFTLCPAADDITRPFGDPEEASLKSALAWLNEGQCGGATGSRLRRAQPRRIDGPRWQRSDLPDAPFGLSPWVR